MAENLNEGKSKKELYDEQKALKAVQKEKELKKQLKAEEKKNKGYVNPINSIWVLCLSMVAGIVFAFIYAIISNI